MQMKAIGFALLIMLAPPVGAQEVSPISVAKSNPKSEAEYYAAAHGVPVAQAERSVEVMEARGNEVADLRTEFKSRLAGIYFDHLPSLRIVVRLTGNSPEPARLATNEKGSIPIVFMTGANATLAELDAVLTSHQEELLSKIPSLQGMYADERTGDIVLVIHAAESESEAYAKETPALSKLLGHPVRFEFVPSPERELAYARGGALTSTCTTGFSVKETATGRTGVLTAAHCPNAQAYANYGEPEYVTFPLQFVDERYGPTNDVQWHIPAPGNTPLAEIYGASTSDYGARSIIFRRTRANTALGQLVCLRGAMSGYSCGNVKSTNYRSSSCGILVCSNTWVLVTGPELACTYGDSGGPVYSISTAYGIIKSASSSNPSPGGCHAVIYMSLDFISDMGLQLL